MDLRPNFGYFLPTSPGLCSPCNLGASKSRVHGWLTCGIGWDDSGPKKGLKRLIVPNVDRHVALHLWREGDVGNILFLAILVGLLNALV